MTVSQLADSVQDVKELMELIEYDSLEPVATLRDMEVHTALLYQLIHNTNIADPRHAITDLHKIFSSIPEQPRKAQVKKIELVINNAYNMLFEKEKVFGETERDKWYAKQSKDTRRQKALQQLQQLRSQMNKG